MIEFQCPKCREILAVPDSRAGQAETCPDCGNVSIVPQSAKPEPTPPTQPPAGADQPTLKRCVKCNEFVPKEAYKGPMSTIKCPKCGALQPTTSGKIMAVIFLGILLIPLLFLGYKCSTVTSPSSSPAQVKDGKNTSMAYVMAQGFVKKRLKAPSSAKWPGMFDAIDHAKHVYGQVYVVRSWVDAQNSFGAMLRMNYECRLEQISEHDWKLLSLEMDE